MTISTGLQGYSKMTSFNLVAAKVEWARKERRMYSAGDNNLEIFSILAKQEVGNGFGIDWGGEK